MSTNATIEAARAKLLAYRTGATAGGKPHPIKSLRALALEVGMSPTGLSKLLAGSEPYTPTIRSLVAWYARQQADDAPARVDHLIEMLAEEFAPGVRPEAARRLRATFDRMVELHGLPAAPALPQAPDPPPADPEKRVGKRYTVLMETCPECHHEVPQAQLRQHMRTTHRIGGK